MVSYAIVFILLQYIQMKARKIITTHKYGKTYDHIFKYYSNALEFRMRVRADNIKKKNDIYRWYVKMSSIKEIEVADDYWKKDFGGGISFRLTADWFKWEWYKKHTEAQYLYPVLYCLRSNIQDEFSVEERNKNGDVKFMLADLNWYLRWANIPKKELDTQARELFLSCWKTLRKLWKEWLIQEHDRWMYEDDFNEYCERMEKLQADLVAEMN